MALASFSLADLPPELLLHIISFLEPVQITKLQLVSKYFRDLGRDGRFWKSRCFGESAYLDSFYIRHALRPFSGSTSALGALREHNANVTAAAAAVVVAPTPTPTALAPAPAPVTPTFEAQKRERARIMANWDPSYAAERVNWYDEYIQRHGRIAVNWMQQPHASRHRGGSYVEYTEVRGVALYRPDSAREERKGEGEREGEEEVPTLLAVSPLDDGSVCLWDVNGTKKKRGAIFAQSRPGILFVDGPGADNTLRSRRVDSGVTECVSVDSQRHRAFFAVQSHLIEVDLKRLCVVDCTSFPFSVTTLSTAHPTVPLTVGTNLGIHLHDYRAREQYRRDSAGERLDELDGMSAKEFYERSVVRGFFDNTPLPPMLSLAQPNPLSILHLPGPGSDAPDLSDDIYVAGRFSNILHYDRRNFGSIRDSIFSGGSLCGLTALPFPFSKRDGEQRRRGQMSLDQVEKFRSAGAATGRTLIACGEYNSKGSLELYGLPTTGTARTRRPPPGGGGRGGGGGEDAEDWRYTNRQTASASKLLSVVNHGTRIAVSDGQGYIKWFERDGFTEVRRCRLGKSERHAMPSLFASMPGSDEIARKLLPTRDATGTGTGTGTTEVNDNDLLFWTGDKLGLVRFSGSPGFAAEDFEDKKEALSAEKAAQEREAAAYEERMRRALERQADGTRMMSGLLFDFDR